MANMDRIKSFKTFSEVRASETALKIAEEKATKRTELTAKIAAILDEMDITSFEGLEEDVRKELIAKTFGEVSEETVEEVEEEATEEVEEEATEEVEETETIEEAVNTKSYTKVGKLGYNDQFLGRQSLSKTLSLDLGFNKKHEFGGGNWIGFDHVSMYGTGKGGTILGDALTGKYTYDELKAAAAEWFGIKESVVTEAEVTMDAMNPKDKDFLKFLKKHKVKITDTTEGPNGYPEITMQGKRKDLEAVLADGEFGWDDADLAEYIEEGEDLSTITVKALNEAIIVTGKRDAKKVMNRYIKFFEAYPALGKNAMGVPAAHHLGAVKALYRLAMGDANFHREVPATVKVIKGKLFPVEIKIADLNNTTIKVPTSKLNSIIEDRASAISQAASYSGIGIVEGTAMYLDSIRETKAAEELMAAFNKAFNESLETIQLEERNAFLGARAKAIEEDNEEFEFNGKTYKVIINEADSVNEGEREEQWAMELYTDAVGPDGGYSEDELAKADSKVFDEIIKDAGYKGSRAKKIADEFAKIATESVDTETTEELLEDTQVNEAEINSDEEFKEYATTVLQKAFGEDYDEAKASEVIDGILGKVDGDYGAAVGMLTSSLGESVVAEANADGTISDDEDEEMESVLADVRFMTTELIDYITKETEKIGGPFRAPGYEYDAKKLMKSIMKQKKFKL